MKRAVAACLLLLGTAFLSYRKAGRLWWTYDSPMLLHRALERSWTYEYLVADTQQYLFTPLLGSTYELFVIMFGLEPRRWYLAQVLLVAATATALFAALRLYVSDSAAAAGALLFVLAPPVACAAAALYLIHYLEAILFGALAAIFFIAGVRRDRVWFSAAAAVSYIVAMCAKEIAVPLPLLLVALPEGTLRMRCKHLAAPGIALTLYVVWRLLVIDLPLTGYGWTLTANAVATLPWRLIAAAAGASLAAGLLLIALTVAGAAPALRTRRALLVGIAGLVAAVGPIVPVSSEMQDRFALPLWVWLSCAFAIGVTRWSWRAAILAPAVVVGVIANRQEWTEEFTRNKRMADEAYVWTHERGDVLLRKPAIPTGTMPELEWLKEVHFGHARGSRWFYDDFYLCAHPTQGKRILEYDPRTRRVEEVKASCPPSRTDVPLAVEFEYRNRALYWRFGPYTDGQWRVLFLEGEHAWDVPREGGYRLGSATMQFPVRVRYHSPEGWVTYSDLIALDFARQPKTTWRR